MSRRPLLELLSNGDKVNIDGSLPPSIDERALNRLDHSPAQVQVPTPKRVEDLPVRTASQTQQNSGDDVETETKSGVASSDTEAGWYRVTFTNSFAEGTRPSVVAVCEERQGEFEEGSYDPPQHGSPQGEVPDVVDISLGDIDISSIDLGTYSVSEYSIGSVSISAPEVGSRSIEVGSVSTRNIDEPSTAQVSEIPQDAAVGKVDITSPDIFHFPEEPERQGYEQELKELSRDYGRRIYNDRAQLIDQHIPIIAGVNIRDDLKNFYNDSLNFLYGAGRENQSGEGIIESLYGQIGAIIDDVVREWVVQKATEQSALANTADQSLTDQKDNIKEAIDTIEESINSEINQKVVSRINSRLNEVITNTDDSVKNLRNFTNTELNNLVEEANEIRSDLASNINGELDGLSSDVNEQFSVQSEEVNSAFESISAEANDAFAGIVGEINEALVNQNEDINANLTGLRDSTESNLATLRDDTETNLAELRDSVESALEEVVEFSVDQNFSDFNSNVQSSYREMTKLSQDSLNQSQRLLYNSLGAPEGELITPVQVRNVDSQGFEFLGYEGGMTINWMAMGLTQATEDTDQTEEETPPDDGTDDGTDDGGDNSGDEEDPTPNPPVDTPILDRIVGDRQ